MKCLIACGGTGGHITPGIAIARIICAKFKGAEILFLGATGGMEEEMVRAAGFSLRTLPMRGLSRSLTLENLHALQLALRATRDAKELMREYAPDIVIGTGGYVCYPALRAAIALGIPTAVHESNAIPGLAVRRIASRVGRVWLNFDEARAHLSRRASMLVVGNPIVSEPGRALQRGNGELQLLSFGGSLGASAINHAALALMEALGGEQGVRYVHATGKREYECCLREFRARGLQRHPNLELHPFITDMQAQMEAADLVICRAGAISISELAAYGRAAILVPSPNVTGDHQRANARALQRAGAAIYLEEDQLEGLLLQTVRALLRDPARRMALGKAIRSFHHADANEKICADIRILCQKR